MQEFEEAISELENVRQTPRVLDFFNIDGLYRLTGCVKEEFVKFAIKELVENSLDKRGVQNVLAGIIARGKMLYVYVADDGEKKLDLETLKKIVNFEAAPSSKRGIKGVKRGIIGNALQCCFGISYALWQDDERPTATVQIHGESCWEIGFLVNNGKEVETQIKAVDVENCMASLDPVIHRDMQNSMNPEKATLIILKMPIHEFESPLKVVHHISILNPGVSIYYRENESFYEIKAKTQNAYTPPEDFGDVWWYSFNDFKNLVQEFPEIPLIRFIKLFKRFKDQRYATRVIKQLNFDPSTKMYELTNQELKELFECLRKSSKPISPRSLPILGENTLRLMGATKYFVRRKMVMQKDRVVPFIIEVASFPWSKERTEILESVNFAPSIYRPFSKWAWTIAGDKLETIEIFLNRKGVKSLVLIHLVCPNINWLSPSKGEMAERDLIKGTLISLVKKISEKDEKGLWKQDEIISMVKDIMNSYPDMDFSVRQIFYKLVANYGYPNERQAYKRLITILTKAREEGLIDADRICDFSRPEYYNNPPYKTLDEYLQEKIKLIIEDFDLDRWENQPFYVEVWIEKEALSRVILPICKKYRVNLIVKKGYSSYTQVYRAGKRFPDGKPAIVLYLGDHDPSGLHIEAKLYQRLTQILLKEGKIIPLAVKRVALTYYQILSYGLPPSPLKKVGQGHEKYRKKFGEKTWELDALDPKILTCLLEEEIRKLINWTLWEQMEQTVKNQKRN